MDKRLTPQIFDGHAKLTLDEAEMCEQDWSDTYYNIMNYYFWEPKRLKRLSLSSITKKVKSFANSKDLIAEFKTSHGGTGLEQRVMSSAYIDEEPFNHQLELFFRLAPQECFDSLLNYVGLESSAERPKVLTRTVELVYGGVQPDLLLLYNNSALMIEVKPPRGKSSAGQIAKYAHLSRSLREDRPEITNFRLLYLANGGLDQNFSKNLAVWPDLKKSAEEWVMERKSSAFKLVDLGVLNEVKDQIAKQQPVFISFSQFVESMKLSCTNSETEKRLIDGISMDLIRRNWL